MSHSSIATRTKKYCKSVLFAATAAASMGAGAVATAEEVWLTMDYVKPFQLEREASKIVIGNPGIADVTVEDSTNLLLFGKAPGSTNIFILDEEGNKIDNMIVRVRALGDNMLTFQRGPQRTTYNCLKFCEATVTVGDNNTSFAEVQAQSQQKFQQAATGN